MLQKIILISSFFLVVALMAVPVVPIEFKGAKSAPVMKCTRVTVQGTPYDRQFNAPENAGVWLCSLKGMYCILTGVGAGCSQ